MKKWICFALAIAFLPLFGNDVPKLTLSATGTIRKPADELQLKVGVITLGTTAQEALQENSGKMQEIVGKIEWAGLTKDDYETSQFAINPVYSPYPVNPPPNFSLPSDLSASNRYYNPDLIDPPFDINADGTISVPTGPGIGVTPVEARLKSVTLRQATFRPGGA